MFFFLLFSYGSWKKVIFFVVAREFSGHIFFRASKKSFFLVARPLPPYKMTFLRLPLVFSCRPKKGTWRLRLPWVDAPLPNSQIDSSYLPRGYQTESPDTRNFSSIPSSHKSGFYGILKIKRETKMLC